MISEAASGCPLCVDDAQARTVHGAAVAELLTYLAGRIADPATSPADRARLIAARVTAAGQVTARRADVS